MMGPIRILDEEIDERRARKAAEQAAEQAAEPDNTLTVTVSVSYRGVERYFSQTDLANVEFTPGNTPAALHAAVIKHLSGYLTSATRTRQG